MEDNGQLLLLFYLVDDFQEFNIRGKLFYLGKVLDSDKATQGQMCTLKPIISWAPSHVQHGLMAELLSLVNRINGSKARARFHEHWCSLTDYVKSRPLEHPCKKLLQTCPDAAQFTEWVIQGLKPRGVSKWLLNIDELAAVGSDGEPFIAWALTEQSVRCFNISFRAFERESER